MSVNEKMTALADAIRAKTGETEPLTLDDMAAGVDRVFEAGERNEYDRFWDAYQQNGARANYAYAFYRWPEGAYDPKYPIKCEDDGDHQYAFGYFAGTDTKVEIDLTGIISVANEASGSKLRAFIYEAPNLKRVPRLKMSADNVWDRMLRYCPALEEVTIEGEIAQVLLKENASEVYGVSFVHSQNLSKASILSIVDALSDTPKVPETVASAKPDFHYSVRFVLDNVNKAFETSEGANDGSVSEEWAELVGRKSAWVFILNGYMED